MVNPSRFEPCGMAIKFNLAPGPFFGFNSRMSLMSVISVPSHCLHCSCSLRCSPPSSQDHQCTTRPRSGSPARRACARRRRHRHRHRVRAGSARLLRGVELRSRCQRRALLGVLKASGSSARHGPAAARSGPAAERAVRGGLLTPRAPAAGCAPPRKARKTHAKSKSESQGKGKR